MLLLEKKNLLLAILLFSLPFSLFPQKKPLDHTVYDSWKNLKNIDITDNGNYAICIISEQEGDDCLFIKNLNGKQELYLPRAYEYQLYPGQRFVLAKVKASFTKIRQEKIKKTKEEKMPKDTLVIIELGKMKMTKIPSVKNYKTGKDFSEYIAYTIDDSIKSKDNTRTLVIRHIEKNNEDTLKNVSNYVFSKNGKTLAVTTKVDEKDSVNIPEVYFIDLNKYNKKIVSAGKKEYLTPSLSENGTQLTFLATTDSAKKEIKEYALYYYQSDKDSAVMLADKSHINMPDSWSVSQNMQPVFSPNEKRLLFGIAPVPLPKDTAVPDFEKAQVDIWHWQEPEIQPAQLINLDRTKKKAYLSYINLEKPNEIMQLSNETIPDVYISQKYDGQFALGVSRLPYRLKSQWDVNADDTYDMWIYDLSTGNKKQIKKELCAKYRFSWYGNYLVWYDLKKQHYYSYNVKSEKEICLSCDLNIIFWNEENDMPTLPSPYGMSYGFEDDKGILVYDKYDIWKLDPSGKNAPENITKGIGRKNNITFRYIKTDSEPEYITPKENLLLSAFDNTSKKNGFYQLDTKKNLQKYILDGYNFTTLAKAKNKNTYIFVKSNFNTPTDLYVTSNNWKSDRKLTNINPQIKDYSWGSVELISWEAFDGNKSQGLLYKPEGFNPEQKYPMITYFYERSSDELYTYYMPQPSWSIINIPFYVSRGYIIFVPDIHYTAGNPGKNAYDYVISGVEELCKNPWVDKENLGVQGQSWGGYQIAYLVTKTNIFKCAEAGAPVSNMFSAYNGIRWESGRSRQFQYEQTQSRIGKTMWEAPELYHENSPVFFADKVETPLLIMHNDKDGAVPWYQGIEYFMALRRLGKPVWMLQYNNEAHNLKERRNRKDLSIRLQQFFDYYLKGEPMPKWMQTGVPAIDKGTDYGFEYSE